MSNALQMARKWVVQRALINHASLEKRADVPAFLKNPYVYGPLAGAWLGGLLGLAGRARTDDEERPSELSSLLRGAALGGAAGLAVPAVLSLPQIVAGGLRSVDDLKKQQQKSTGNGDKAAPSQDSNTSSAANAGQSGSSSTSAATGSANAGQSGSSSTSAATGSASPASSQTTSGSKDFVELFGENLATGKPYAVAGGLTAVDRLVGALEKAPWKTDYLNVKAPDTLDVRQKKYWEGYVHHKAVGSAKPALRAMPANEARNLRKLVDAEARAIRQAYLDKRLLSPNWKRTVGAGAAGFVLPTLWEWWLGLAADAAKRRP